MPRKSRSQKRQEKKNRRLIESLEVDNNMSREDILDFSPSPEKVEAQNTNQGYYLCSIQSNTLTFGIGSAGTGKTYLAVCMACEMLHERKIRKIVITRPAVESGKSLGALPGELSDKMEPYISPVYDVLVERMGKSKVDHLMKTGVIVCESLNYMRGKTFDSSFLILDEAQNSTPTEILMFLTRVGRYSKVVINGDLKQKDLKGECGLSDAFYKLKDMRDSGYVEFGIDDIVRSGFVRDVLIKYAS